MFFRVPDISVEKCLPFQKEEKIWDVKQQILAALPKVFTLENLPQVSVADPGSASASTRIRILGVKVGLKSKKKNNTKLIWKI